MRRCSKCLVEKDDCEFGKKGNVCKECVRIKDRERYALNPNSKKESSLKYQKGNYDQCRQRIERWREENREKVQEQNRASYQRNKQWYENRNAKQDKDKRYARMLLNAHIKMGKIDRPERCQECNCESKLHGHHQDYQKPLEVLWLCAKCHNRIHRAMPNEHC
jgi:hypothetical protein